MPKKNDNRVGNSDGPGFNGGRQTAAQADIVKQEGGGRTDADRASAAKGGAGRGNPALGGSSGGHSDQMASKGGAEDRKVAGGLSFSEQTDGKGDSGKRKPPPG